MYLMALEFKMYLIANNVSLVRAIIMEKSMQVCMNVTTSSWNSAFEICKAKQQDPMPYDTRVGISSKSYSKTKCVFNHLSHSKCV